MQTIETPDRTDTLQDPVPAAWSQAAAAWAHHADMVDARVAAVTEAMLDLAAVGPDARVLELACGPGGAGLAAAERVGPGGEVVLSDAASEMTAVAARRAVARGLSNVRTRELDLTAVDEPDARYDVVLCRAGLMLVPDPAAAVREIRRVLRPGGRAAVAVWGPRRRNPWLGIPFDAVTAVPGDPFPPAGVMGVFSLEDRDRLAGVFAGGGLVDVTVAEVATPLRVPSFDAWWSTVTALAGPLARRLAFMADGERDAVRAQAEAGSRAYLTPEGLEFPGVILVAGGVAPRA